ncbi:MAG: DUF4860 domain-containing protein [Vallitaleaceae bacterium]|nr:DUF4860 domain-containing protein [Vallitaleaceae bacterium]
MKRISIESVLVMILFVVFTASIGILIVEGQKSYETIIATRNMNENERIALSYIHMKIRQNNGKESVSLMYDEKSKKEILRISHHGEEEGFVTYIIHYEGELYECYQYADEEPDVSLGEKIAQVDEMFFSYDEEYSLLNIGFLDGNALSIHLNMGEGNHGE